MHSYNLLDSPEWSKLLLQKMASLVCYLRKSHKKWKLSSHFENLHRFLISFDFSNILKTSRYYKTLRKNLSLFKIEQLAHLCTNFVLVWIYFFTFICRSWCDLHKQICVYGRLAGWLAVWLDWNQNCDWQRFWHPKQRLRVFVLFQLSTTWLNSIVKVSEHRLQHFHHDLLHISYLFITSLVNAVKPWALRIARVYIPTAPKNKLNGLYSTWKY